MKQATMKNYFTQSRILSSADVEDNAIFEKAKREAQQMQKEKEEFERILLRDQTAKASSGQTGEEEADADGIEAVKKRLWLTNYGGLW